MACNDKSDKNTGVGDLKWKSDSKLKESVFLDNYDKDNKLGDLELHGIEVNIPNGAFSKGTKLMISKPTEGVVYSSKGALLSAIIAELLLRKKVKKGITSAVFLIIYSIGRFISFLYRDFPEATATSNIIRGSVVYGGIVIFCSLYIHKIIKKQ